MPDDKRFNPEPDHELDGTRPIDQVDATRHIPPPPGTSHVQLPARPRESRRQDKRQRDSRSSPPPDARKQEPLKRGEARDRSKSALYLPAWSVLLMLVTVFVVAFGIIALVIALGGGVQPAGSPRIIIVTAPDSGPTPALTLAPSATGALLSNPGSQGAFPTFALEGPTLPPVVLSPTPISITVGSTVIVNADDGLNIRSEAGLDQNILFNADNGARFTVTDGPIQANGLTWWQVRDPDDASRFGWAAADYLQIQAAQ
jgi:hypothetical protein